MLNLETSPRNYFPSVYDEVLEIDKLANAEDKVFKEALAHLNTLWRNSFIVTNDIDAITQHEKVLGIVLDPNEKDGLTDEEYLDFRRERVLNRFRMIPEFTMPWLRARLDSLLGAGNWVYSIDFDKRELVVETVEKSAVWLHELSVTVHHAKPATLLFVSRPLQVFRILVNETVSKRDRTDNYRLGTWKLGNLPFSQFSEPEVAKMADTPSIQPLLLEKLATFTADDVKSVLVNNTHKISNFISKSATGGMVSIEYEVYASHGLGEITNVKLLDALDHTLAEITVSIDNTFNVRMRHNIHIEEGLNAETA